MVLEQRAATFGKFLELIETGWNKAMEYSNWWPPRKDKSEDEVREEAKVGIFQAFFPAIVQGRIVRLYLPKEFRNEFTHLTNEYVRLFTDGNSFDEMEKKLDRIQQIFEQQLEPGSWFMPVSSLIARLTPRSRADAP